ncbi:hypothetical protein DS843_16705 [Roseomonas genomospecies 6]|uniref:Uncharacterized protein n=1 Tax=Roseomonas genomospecies 6 TaxID=214106 RepID=A0A9W7NIF3_9PROT|nr:hypothetical protein DS843_16705 [Roseomonas genomospecies 6]
MQSVTGGKGRDGDAAGIGRAAAADARGSFVRPHRPFAVRGPLGGTWGGAAVSALDGAVAPGRSRRLWARPAAAAGLGRLKAVGMAEALAGAVWPGVGRPGAIAAVAQRGAPPLTGGGFRPSKDF